MRILGVEQGKKRVHGDLKIGSKPHEQCDGFYVGEGEYCELDGLERLRKEQGWTFGLPQDEHVGKVLSCNVNKPIVINGGSASECVAFFVDISLRVGVASVAVPLDEIIERSVGVESDEEQMRINANSLARGLRTRRRFELGDPRIRVEPKEIWLEECAKVTKKQITK